MSNVLAKGIDVSEHQGTINWNKVKNAGIQFVMIRAGYGINTVDSNFIKNITGAKYAGLNIGVYWFSYANNVQRATQEAEFFLKTIEPYRSSINMPVCFDWEYDSLNYIRRTYGTVATMPLVSDMAKAFLTKVENAGYYAMNYTNPDCITRFFNDSVLKRFDTWLACWSATAPATKYPYGIWQYGAESNYIDSKYVDGITGVVDKNYMYKDYPSWYKGRNEGNVVPDNLSNPAQVTPTTKVEKVDPPKAPSQTPSFKAGDTVSLSDTMIYASSSATTGGKKTGTFYIYSSEVINGKIRITNAKSNVGRTPIGLYVTGFVRVSDITKTNTPSPAPVSKSYAKGTKITLNKVPLYASATTGNGRLISGTYWLYDGVNVSGRYRITNSPSNVGKTPIGTYVTGFINKSDI